MSNFTLKMLAYQYIIIIAAENQHFVKKTITKKVVSSEYSSRI